ncbi:MAG: hypothetical protein ACUVTZ_00520 [Armatimonadota bacterium]
MDDIRSEVLQAEAAIRELAEELARAKGIADGAEAVERRLERAAQLLEEGTGKFDQAHKSVTENVAKMIQEARAELDTASNRLAELRSSIQERIAALSNQNETMISIFREQLGRVNMLAHRLTIGLILIGMTAVVSFITLALLMLRTQ